MTFSKTGHLLRFIPLLFFTSYVSSTLAASDTFQISGLDPQTGTFTGYEKGWFHLTRADGKQLKVREQRVQRATIDPPAEVYVTLVGGKRIEDLALSAFEESAFVFTSSSGTRRYPLRKIKSLELGFRSDRMHTVTAVGTVISHGEEIDILRLLPDNRISMLHFHSPTIPSSTRLEGYLGRLHSMGQGELEYLKISVADPGAPILEQYGVESLPQIWVYDTDGALVETIDENPTPRDVDRAIKRARRPGWK